MSGFDIVSSALGKALQATELSQRTIANNIANISTPGFKRGHVDFQSALERAVATGNPKAVESFEPSVTVDNGTAMKLDGNNVDLNDEMVALAKNTLMSGAYVNLISSRVGALRYVISDGRR
jgi:flagellar basal-body rod protein FlgB